MSHRQNWVGHPDVAGTGPRGGGQSLPTVSVTFCGYIFQAPRKPVWRDTTCPFPASTCPEVTCLLLWAEREGPRSAVRLGRIPGEVHPQACRAQGGFP